MDKDAVQAGAMAAIHDNGLIVPDDIAVIEFGNVERSTHVRPALTTVTEHRNAVAAAICRCAIPKTGARWSAATPRDRWPHRLGS